MSQPTLILTALTISLECSMRDAFLFGNMELFGVSSLIGSRVLLALKIEGLHSASSAAHARLVSDQHLLQSYIQYNNMLRIAWEYKLVD